MSFIYVKFHIVFIAQICSERKAFDIDGIIGDVYKKMYDRHPHVFQKQKLDVPIEIKWEDMELPDGLIAQAIRFTIPPEEGYEEW